MASPTTPPLNDDKKEKPLGKYHETDKEFDKKYAKIFWQGCLIVITGISLFSWFFLWVLPRIYGY